MIERGNYLLPRAFLNSLVLTVTSVILITLSRRWSDTSCSGAGPGGIKW